MWPFKTHSFPLVWRNALKDCLQQRGWSCPAPNARDVTSSLPGQLTVMTDQYGTSRWDNSEESFRLQSSLKNPAEAGRQLKTHLCLASAPALSVSLTSLQISPGSISSINHLHKNPHLRLCFYANWPLREEWGNTGAVDTKGNVRAECEFGLDRSYRSFPRTVCPVGAPFTPDGQNNSWRGTLRDTEEGRCVSSTFDQNWPSDINSLTREPDIHWTSPKCVFLSDPKFKI